MDVCIILGSRSDLPVAKKATKVLDDFGVEYELRVASAHRAPKYLEGIIDAALDAALRAELLLKPCRASELMVERNRA